MSSFFLIIIACIAILRVYLFYIPDAVSKLKLMAKSKQQSGQGISPTQATQELRVEYYAAKNLTQKKKVVKAWTAYCRAGFFLTECLSAEKPPWHILKGASLSVIDPALYSIALIGNVMRNKEMKKTIGTNIMWLKLRPRLLTGPQRMSRCFLYRSS